MPPAQQKWMQTSHHSARCASHDVFAIAVAGHRAPCLSWQASFHMGRLSRVICTMCVMLPVL